MKRKGLLKIGVDVLMAFLLLGQMGYHMMDSRMHERSGILLCLLFAAHHVLNGGWHRNLLKGRYSARRILLTAVNLLLTLAMVAVAVSAVLVSRHVFDFLGLHMRSAGRRLHMPATMWMFVLTGLHLGLHWSMVVSGLRRAIGGRTGRVTVWAARLLLAVVSVMGIHEFVIRGLWMELFMLREFAFLEYGESLWSFFSAYAAILTVFAALSYYTARGLGSRKGRSYDEKNA